jgi:hypothetical protein
MVRECLNKENINDCRFPPLALALAHFGAAKPNYRHRWKPTVQHLVNLGSDLHQGRSSEYTLLDHLMNEVDCPFESVSLGEKWLDILRESGVSVQEYLETEYRLHYNPVFFLPMMQVHYKTDDRPRSLVITEEPPSLSWDWFIDPAGKACDVLEEFKNLGWGAKYLYGCFQERNGIHWPFFYPEWQWLACRTADREPWLIEVVRHQNDRFERRCQRKAMKLAKAQGILHRGPRIPGAWID